MLWGYLLLGLSSFFLAQGAPLTIQEAKLYLVEYGYLNPQVMKPDSDISPEKMESMMKDALTEFQQFIGLKATGQMDADTMETMQLPRCGVKDKFEFENEISRKKRYVRWGSRWMKNELTYRIKTYPKLARDHRMLRAAVDKEMHLAFSIWANVTKLFFKNVESSQDINIEFVKPDMNNKNTIIFERGGLAYATMPQIGDIVFNENKNWTIRQKYGWNLLAVAVHEIGHVLGLAHSDVRGSIMQPVLSRGYMSDFRLHQDDIAGIQELYGVKNASEFDICQDSSFDCIFKNPDGSQYVFKGMYYWKVGFDGLLSKFPQLIRHRWHGLPAEIDAALGTSSGRTYFFKGDKYWAYERTFLIPGHPKLIREGWPGIPDNISAATWYGNSQFYFFKGDKFWLYDSYQKPNVPRDFPKHISDWDNNIGGELDDVLYLPSGYFYFFSQGHFQRYSNITGLVYGPRSVRNGWFHCDDN